MTLEEVREIAIPACRQFNVKQLDVFGSLARGQNHTASDIDLLVEFEEPEQNLSKRFVGLLHYLEDTLGCKIDLLTTVSLKNPYFRQQVFSEKISIYGR